MSAPKLTLIDMDADSQRSAQSQLQFHEFSGAEAGAAQLDVHESQTLTFSHSPDTPGSDSDAAEADLLKGEGARQAPSFWSFEYYQQFFDVDTSTVMERVLWSMVPKPGVSYLQHRIRPKPDLYGPFWVCVTLVFTIAISGNLANYLQAAAGHDYHWKYDFHAVTYAATAIFSYAWVVPMALWAVLKWRGVRELRLTFLELLCIYGYSLSIYVPISVLWVIELEWLRWLLVLVGAALSGSVLLSTTWPATQGEQRLVVLAGVITLHLLLAVGFMLYFFHVAPIEVTTIISVSDNASIVKVESPSVQNNSKQTV